MNSIFETLFGTSNNDFAGLRCINCDMPFALPTDIYNLRRKDGKSFFCPKGHSQSFVETEAVKLQKKIDLLERELLYAKDSNVNKESYITKLANTIRTQRGSITKLKKRIAVLIKK